MSLDVKNIYLFLFRLKKAVQKPKEALKQPFTPLDNLINGGEGSSRMAFRRQICEPKRTEAGTKLPTSNGGNIKDKISLWENKESTLSPLTPGLSRSGSAKRTESNNKTSDKLSADSCRRGHAEEQEVGKENLEKPGGSRPCSPAVNDKNPGPKEKSKDDRRPCSPPASEKQQVGSKNPKRATEPANVEKRAVFTLFRKLETLGENHRKAPAELGNYFCPPSKDTKGEPKKREAESLTRTSGSREGKEHQENVYTEPGAPPINPVPKPQRTFQHPAGINQNGERRGQRNLPPLPSISSKTSSKPPSGFYRRPKPDRVLDSR